MSDIENIWREKSDEDLLEAAAQLDDYTEEGRGVIRAELKRRGLEDPVEQAMSEDAAMEAASDEAEAPAEMRTLPACTRCEAQLRYVGTRRLLGEPGHLFEHAESFALCVCPQCGHVDLFIADGLPEE
jgi:hypothetical protein